MYTIEAVNSGTSTTVHEDGTTALAASGKFAEEVNQIPSAEFDILPFNPAYSGVLRDRKTIIRITNTRADKISFEGFLLRTKERMTSKGQFYKTCICEGFLGCLCDTIQPYHNYANATPAQFLSAVLSVHNSLTSADKHITLGTCNVTGNTNSKTTAYRNTLEEIKVNLIERLGGEIRIRSVNGSLVLDYMTSYGSVSNTTIELAKNMQSLEVSSDSTNIITRLIPLGAQLHPGDSAERLTIAAANSGVIYIDDTAAIAKYGIIVGTVEFDDITVASNLKSAGQTYLANNNRIKKAYSAQVLDLSTISDAESEIVAGNTYRFVNGIMGIDENLRVIKRTVDIYKPYKPTLEIGDKSVRLTDIAARTARLIEYDLPQQKNEILTSAKSIATSLINAGINGYVVVNENEILIMDTPDKTTATRVWRWNSGGFGYSSTGYSGPYGTAITMDGAIVADFITAGILRGIEITNGNGTFHVSPNGTVTASALHMTGGSIHVTTDSESYDVIQLSCGDWTHSFSPLEWSLENTSIGCKILCQAGRLYFIYNGETIASISTDTGIASFDDVDFATTAGGARYSLRQIINSILSRLDALEGA